MKILNLDDYRDLFRPGDFDHFVKTVQDQLKRRSVMSVSAGGEVLFTMVSPDKVEETIKKEFTSKKS